MLLAQDEGDIYSREVSQHYSNERRFDPNVPTHVCVTLKIVHRAPVIQADKQNVQLFREKGIQ
jgi:hypothetical protein